MRHLLASLRRGSLITPERIRELVRYGVTGVVGVTLNVSVAMLLTEVFGVHYLVSLALCSVLVTIAGFLLNRSWTFRKRGSAIAPEFVRYALATAFNTIIGLWSCAFLVEKLRVPYTFSIAIVSLVFAPMTYVVHRVWTFGLSWLYGD